MQIVTNATAYTCQETSKVYILVIHEALWIGDRMEYSMINPNQLWVLWDWGWDNPFDMAHNLSIRNLEHLLTIPLQTEGISIVFVNTRLPTQEELDTCNHVVLTCDIECWNPHKVCLAHKPICGKEENWVHMISSASWTLDYTWDEKDDDDTGLHQILLVYI